MLEKAPGLGADVVMLDLEDAVAPDDKERRARAGDRARCTSSTGRAARVSLRINGLDTHWCYRDIVDVIEQAGEHVDTVLIPKVSCAGDVHLVATLLAQIEAALRAPAQIGISVLIETAAGMHNVDEIAAACPERMEAMVFGVADYAASLQSHTTSIGGSTAATAVRTDAGAEHWGDQWHYPLARIAVACRAHGLRPIDGPYGDFGDPEGYRAAARRAAVLGYEGKWAIHPSQIELANDVFTPDAAAAEKTRRIVAAMAEAAREGRGAVSLDGRLIDAASLRMAEVLLTKLEQIEARESARPGAELAAG